MNLQSLLLVDWIEVRHNNNEIRDFLSPTTVARMLARLQKPETWHLLRGIAKVGPSSDILPVRAAFGGGATTNIAQCRIKSGPDTYYTIADVVASFLLTGKMPEILETITLHPQGRVETRTKALFNDQCYTVDLTKDDLFVRLIDLWSEIKADAKRAAQEDRAYLEARQEALKLIANSTANGALVEYRDDERARPRWATVWYGDEDECVRQRAQKLEQPGAWFAGPVGVLIPAAGRLLLATAERLATDRDMQHVFCDTDSLCFARPGAMDFPTFAAKTHEIVDWFTPLSP